MANTNKKPSEKTIRALLEKHACPVPFHAVRTRFLGNIASPTLSVSPIRLIESLWGGELPVFESMEEANELLQTLGQGLWNDLAQHQKRIHPFKLTLVNLEPSLNSLGTLARIRREEIDGFIEGLFGEDDEMSLPERARHAVDRLSELRAMMGGIEDLVALGPADANAGQLETTFKHLRDVKRIMETEMQEVVLSCAKARKQMLESLPMTRPTIH